MVVSDKVTLVKKLDKDTFRVKFDTNTAKGDPKGVEGVDCSTFGCTLHRPCYNEQGKEMMEKCVSQKLVDTYNDNKDLQSKS